MHQNLGNLFLICFRARAPSLLFKNKPKQADPDPVNLENSQFLINSNSFKIFLTNGNLEITTFSKELFSSFNLLTRSNLEFDL
jgi:hypothetical protein